MLSVEERQSLRQQERALEDREIWEAIYALEAQVKALGGAGLTGAVGGRMRENLLRAGALQPGDLPDEALLEGNIKAWREDMGQIFPGEILLRGGEKYVCLQAHGAQALYAPGSAGGRALFRLLREEPEDGYLDFAWGELVPFGAVRRDPEDGRLYTPVKEHGVTLHEPHLPHMVASEYKVLEIVAPDEGEAPAGEAVVRWADLAEGHVLAPGDIFSDYGKKYRVLREFQRLEHMRPPALLGDFYAVAE